MNGTEYLGEAFTYSSPTQNPTTRDPQRFDVNLASPSDSTIEGGVRRSGGAIRVYAVWAVLHYTTPSPP
ncbi:MAG TPA: hypothetical protein PJ994_06525, partial [Tepidiformaceae bacterium]|nr:hypothetical protein [Tepidiformaceae bacterium]